MHELLPYHQEMAGYTTGLAGRQSDEIREDLKQVDVLPSKNQALCVS